MSNILIIAHKFLPHPDDDLILYLNNKKYTNVMHIMHEFPDCPTRQTICKWYKNGVLYWEHATRDYIGYPEVFIYIKELTSTLYYVFKSKIKWDKSVCVDGLCTLFGLLLKLVGKIDKVVYWAMDFVPEKRFSSRIKNITYENVNKIGYKMADEMWDLSPRMVEAREKFLGVKRNSYKNHKVVPYGVWTSRIKKYSYEECEKNSVVFMGHLLEKQGVQFVIRIIPSLVDKMPDFIFKIIGTGRYEESLKKIAKDLGVEKYCLFMGMVKKEQELENKIAKSCIAVAPYVKELDTWTYYADPGKIKKYLSCGVPVALTDIPWNASSIDKNRCGVIVDINSRDDFINKIIYLMQKNVNSEYRKNTIEYTKGFDYEGIFSKLGF